MRFRLINELKEESRGYSDGYFNGKQDFLNGLEKDLSSFGSYIYKEAYKLGYLAGYNFYLEFDGDFKIECSKVRKHDID